MSLSHFRFSLNFFVFFSSAFTCSLDYSTEGKISIFYLRYLHTFALGFYYICCTVAVARFDTRSLVCTLAYSNISYSDYSSFSFVNVLCNKLFSYSLERSISDSMNAIHAYDSQKHRTIANFHELSS